MRKNLLAAAAIAAALVPGATEPVHMPGGRAFTPRKPGTAQKRRRKLERQLGTRRDRRRR